MLLCWLSGCPKASILFNSAEYWYAGFHNAECCNAERHKGVCNNVECAVMLSVIKLKVGKSCEIMLNIVMFDWYYVLY